MQYERDRSSRLIDRRLVEFGSHRVQHLVDRDLEQLASRLGSPDLDGRVPPGRVVAGAEGFLRQFASVDELYAPEYISDPESHPSSSLISSSVASRCPVKQCGLAQSLSRCI